MPVPPAVELHDDLGAILLPIGAQVRDLHGDPDVSPDLAARLERGSGQLSGAGSALRESLTSLRAADLLRRRGRRLDGAGVGPAPVRGER